MSNTDFAFPLAIKGTEQQLKNLAVKMVGMGYNDNSSVTNKSSTICTNWCGVGNKLFAICGVNPENQPNEISFDTHSYECILALLAARKSGEYQAGEWVVRDSAEKAENAINGKMYKVVRVPLECNNGWISIIDDKGSTNNAYLKRCFTRPTFDQIVALFAQKQDLVTMTVNADEWKALNEEIATLKDDNKFLHDANSGLRDLTLELEARNAKLTKNNAYLAELVHQLKPEPIEPEWIPFDADKWSGKVEDIRDFQHDSLLYAKIKGDHITVVYSTNSPSEISISNVGYILNIRNPNFKQ